MMLPTREPWRSLVGILIVFGPLYLLSSYGVSWATPMALAIFAGVVLIRYTQLHGGRP